MLSARLNDGCRDSTEQCCAGSAASYQGVMEGLRVFGEAGQLMSANVGFERRHRGDLAQRLAAHAPRWCCRPMARCRHSS
jgi:hypothetical protein